MLSQSTSTPALAAGMIGAMPRLSLAQFLLLFSIIAVLFAFAAAGNWDAVITIGIGLVLGLAVSTYLVIRRRKAATQQKRHRRKRRKG